MDSVTDLLKQMGFSGKMCKAYLSALKFGSQPASIIARGAKLNRVTTYVLLKDLAAQGLARMVTKRGVQFFTVISPQDLIRYAESKAEEWKSIGDETAKLLPEFLQCMPYGQPLPKVSFYEGVEGVKEAYDDTLKNTEKILGFLTVERIHPELKQYFIRSYIPKRIRKNIPCEMILSYSKGAETYRKSDKKYLRKTFLIPRSHMPFETEIAIYGKDRVAIISFTQTDLNAVVIQNQEVHNTLKAIFYFCRFMARHLKK